MRVFISATARAPGNSASIWPDAGIAETMPRFKDGEFERFNAMVLNIVLYVVKNGVYYKYAFPPKWFFVETIRDHPLAWIES